MRTFLTRSARIVDKISFFGLKASVFVILVMLIGNVADVIGRNAGFPGIPMIYEFMEASLTFSVFLAVAYVQHQDGHVSASLVTDRLPERMSRIIRGVGLGIAAVVLTWSSWGSVQAAISSVARAEAKFGLYNFPVWPARIIVAAGLTLLTLQVLISIAKVMTHPTNLLKDENPIEGHNL